MKTGIAGTGMIVNEFLENLHGMEGLEVTAVCGTARREADLQQMSRTYGIQSWYTDYDSMLQDDMVEVVYVAVPNHLHYEFSRKAVLAGRHVICEKPFTSNIREMRELHRLAQEHHVMLLEAVTTRYLPNMQAIRERLPELGNIRIVTANYSQYSSRYDAFKRGEVLPAFDPHRSGGALMDLNIYNINLMVMLFGAPRRVAYTANVDRGIDTSGSLTLDYGDFQCVCIGAKDCRAPVMTSIQGDEGCIIVSSPANVMSGYELYRNTDSMGGPKKMYDHHEGKHRMYHEFREFIRVIDQKDFVYAERMMEVSLITMDIQTRARQEAGIVFDADREQ